MLFRLWYLYSDDLFICTFLKAFSILMANKDCHSILVLF